MLNRNCLIRPLLWSSLLAGSIPFFNACTQAPHRPSYRGIPDDPVMGSFKVSLLQQDRSVDQELSDIEGHADDVAAEVGCEVESIESIAWEPGALSAGLASTYRVSFEGCDFNQEKLEAVMDSFSGKSVIAAVEPVANIQLSAIENDPRKPSQTFLQNINRDAACDLLPSGERREVAVAVIDSGVDEDHPDLVNAFKRDRAGNIIGANFVGKGSRSAPDNRWDDRNGHGTHVAGLVAATANNGEGVVGVASCANVKIMPVRVMDASGAGNSIEIDRGVQWAIANGADIINLSLGGNVRFRSPQSNHPSPLYAEAAARGIVVFAAAGNDGITLGGQSGSGYVYSYPASYDHVISVAATNGRNQLTNFSNRGETVDIAAPGEQDLSTYMGGGYQRLSGTSMASPVAAGAYALALSGSGLRDRLASDKVESLLLDAANSGNLRGVASSGVIDAKTLTEKLASTRNPTLPEQPEEPSGNEPNNPEEPSSPQNPSAPEEPGMQPAPADEMLFIGLTDDQRIRFPQTIALRNWPKGKTASIYLYWVTANDPEPRAFVLLDGSNLSADGREVRTDLAYAFYGKGELVAEAVDASGNRLQLTSVSLQGL